MTVTVDSPLRCHACESREAGCRRVRAGVREAVAVALEAARAAGESVPPMELELRCLAFWPEGRSHG